MALSIVKELLQQYQQSLYDEGIVNDQFYHIQTLKTVEEPDHAVHLINTYCTDVEKLLSELTTCMDDQNADFLRLASLSQQIEEKSWSTGAEPVRLACADLIKAACQMDIKNFFRALSWTKSEFARTRNKLLAFVQMELRIMRLESSQKK